jgi:small-conductance mechanosensitive channel
MRAWAPILKSIQKPFTILGLTTTMLGAVLLVGLVPMLFLFLIGLKNASIIAFVTIGTVAFVFAARATRKDPHIEQKITVANKFYKIKKDRHLKVGVPPLDQQKTRKKKS